MTALMYDLVRLRQADLRADAERSRRSRAARTNPRRQGVSARRPGGRR
jgi:hypothetical protein